MTDCVNVMQICTICEEKEPTSKVADHDCVSLLKMKIQRKDEELARKNAENEALTKRIRELELDDSQKVKASKNQDEINCSAPRCLKGHLMRLTNTPIQRLSNGRIVPGINLNCNGCLQPFNIVNGYFHCGQSSCDYDFCNHCGLRLQNAPVPKTQLMTCPRNHVMNIKNDAKRRQGIPLSSLGIHVPINCDNCKSKCSFVQGYVSCDYECNFDLCVNCASCPSGHLLKAAHGEGQCQRCKKHFINSNHFRCDPCACLVCHMCLHALRKV